MVSILFASTGWLRSRGEYLSNGRHIHLEGRLQTRKWKGPEGEKRTAIEVVANQMQILDPSAQERKWGKGG